MDLIFSRNASSKSAWLLITLSPVHNCSNIRRSSRNRFKSYTFPIIYINDIIDNIHYSNIRLFADDIILYKQVSSVNDANRLQIDLQSLQYWEEKCLLKFNISINVMF